MLDNQKILIIAATKKEADDFARSNKIDQNSYHYVYDISHLNGHHNAIITRVGRWWKNPNYTRIMIRAKALCFKILMPNDIIKKIKKETKYKMKQNKKNIR